MGLFLTPFSLICSVSAMIDGEQFDNITNEIVRLEITWHSINDVDQALFLILFISVNICTGIDIKCTSRFAL